MIDARKIITRFGARPGDPERSLQDLGNTLNTAMRKVSLALEVAKRVRRERPELDHMVEVLAELDDADRHIRKAKMIHYQETMF